MEIGQAVGSRDPFDECYYSALTSILSIDLFDTWPGCELLEAGDFNQGNYDYEPQTERDTCHRLHLYLWLNS
jgi:hypothetical protein